MCEPAGCLVDNYNLQYYNSPNKFSIDVPLKSLETHNYEKNVKYDNKRESNLSDFGNTTLYRASNDFDKRETRISDYGNSSIYNSKRETRISDYGSITLCNSKRETRISDFESPTLTNSKRDTRISDFGSTTLYRVSNEDTFLPIIESVLTDNDLSDLANEFAEYGKSFSIDEVSFRKEEGDPYSQAPKSKRGFSKKFRMEINPQKRYTYNNLYNLNNEIYRTSPHKGDINNENNNEEIEEYTNDVSRLDVRYIQSALLDIGTGKSNPNDNILKGLNDTTDKRITKSFMDMNLENSTFNNRMSAITKVGKDSEVFVEENVSLNSKNRMSYQNTFQNQNAIQNQNVIQNENVLQNSRPIYIANQQPVQSNQFNVYDKNDKSLSASPRSSPLNEQSINQYSKTENTDMYNKNDKIASPKPIPIARPRAQYYSETEDSEPYNHKSYFSFNKNNIKKKTAPLSVSAPSDGKNYMDSINKVSNRSFYNLSQKNRPTSQLKSEIQSSIAFDTLERKVSTKMPKHKKKKMSLFAHCCSSRDDSFYEESSRYFNKEVYINYQREQMHSFEAKRINNSRNNIIVNSATSTYMKENRKSVAAIKESRKPITVMKENRKPVTVKENINPVTSMKENINSVTSMKENINPVTSMKENINPVTSMKENINPVTAMKEKTTANLITNYINKEINQDDNNLSFMSTVTATSCTDSCTSSSTSSSTSFSDTSSYSSISDSTSSDSTVTDSTVSYSTSNSTSFSNSSSDCSSYSSTSESESSYSNMYERYINEQRALEESDDSLSIDDNVVLPQEPIDIPLNQSNIQYIQSKRDEYATVPVYETSIPVYETSVPVFETSTPLLESPSPSPLYQFHDIPTPTYSSDTNTSTVMSSASSVPDTFRHSIKYCTTYELSQDGNWKLVERRYPDSEVVKVAVISKKMI